MRLLFYGVAGLLAVALFFIILIALAAMWERRRVWFYVPEAEAPPGLVPPQIAYGNRAAQSAHEAGFTYLGPFGDNKGKLYHVRYDFWRSATGDVLAIIGTGKVASVPVETTWLHTPLVNGRWLITFDHQAGGEVDLSDVQSEALVAEVVFTELLRRHHARIASAASPPVPFSPTDPLGDLYRLREKRITRLVELGYARFLDNEKSAWSYTPRGAVALSLRQYFTAHRREFSPDTQPV